MCRYSHAGPRLLRRERFALLEEFDGDRVGRADEGHAAVARWAVDGDARVHQPLAGRVDILHPVGEVAEIAAAVVPAVVIPIVGELDLRILIARRGEEVEREAAASLSMRRTCLRPSSSKKRIVASGSLTRIIV
jgi:hypothetical protein